MIIQGFKDSKLIAKRSGRAIDDAVLHYAVY